LAQDKGSFNDAMSGVQDKSVQVQALNGKRPSILPDFKIARLKVQLALLYEAWGCFSSELNEKSALTCRPRNGVDTKCHAAAARFSIYGFSDQRC
jgi:hypothetical protein